MDRGAWQATAHRVVRVRHDLATNTLYGVRDFPLGPVVKTLCSSAGDRGSIPDWGARSHTPKLRSRGPQLRPDAAK